MEKDLNSVLNGKSRKQKSSAGFQFCFLMQAHGSLQILHTHIPTHKEKV